MPDKHTLLWEAETTAFLGVNTAIQ